MKNLNEILAWGHATAIETLLQKVSCNCAICDQFSANEDQIRKHLKAKGRSIILHQRHKAESHIAVAAASILARRSFIFSLKHFEDKYHVYLPKGAGKVTEQMASKFIEKYGKEKLSEVAKIHFKNTERVNGYK